MEEPNARYCRNCGEHLHGIYCSRCGQRDNDVFVPVKELISEFVAVLPLFDERLWKTLRALLFAPGTLTTEYLSGKRKQYFSPFKLYFFITFLYFLAGSIAPSEPPDEKERSSSVVNMSPPATDSGKVLLSPKKGVNVSLSDSSKITEWFGDRGMAVLRKLKQDPRTFTDTFHEQRPKIIFLLLPVFALILKLLYARRRVLYVKHLVFAFHFHAFLFLVLLVTDLLDLIPTAWPLLATVPLYGWIPVYLYRSMRTLYGQSRPKTLVKWSLLWGGYLIAFLAGLLIASIIILLISY